MVTNYKNHWPEWFRNVLADSIGRAIFRNALTEAQQDKCIDVLDERRTEDNKGHKELVAILEQDIETFAYFG